jgi:hypothetical protein
MTSPKRHDPYQVPRLLIFVITLALIIGLLFLLVLWL